MAKRKLYLGFQDMRKRKICHKCWGKKTMCICERVAQTTVRHNVLLYMHTRG